MMYHTRDSLWVFTELARARSSKQLSSTFDQCDATARGALARRQFHLKDCSEWLVPIIESPCKEWLTLADTCALGNL